MEPENDTFIISIPSRAFAGEPDEADLGIEMLWPAEVD